MTKYIESVLTASADVLKYLCGNDNFFNYCLYRLEFLKQPNNFDYKYTYWVDSSHGLTLDDEANHKYGESQLGFEIWKQENKHLSIHEIRDDYPNKTITEHGVFVGLISVELMKNNEIDTFKQIRNECFMALCSELGVANTKKFERILFGKILVPDQSFKTIRHEIKIMLNHYFASLTDKSYYDKVLKYVLNVEG